MLSEIFEKKVKSQIDEFSIFFCSQDFSKTSWAHLTQFLFCFDFDAPSEIYGNMCGRTCCTLSPDLVAKACTTVTQVLPEWKEAPCGGLYHPSTNVPPTAYTPILYKVLHQSSFLSGGPF